MRYYMYRYPENIDRTTQKGETMGMVIKEVSEFSVVDENNQTIRKSKLVICNDGIDTEIILEGNGRLRVTTTV